MNLLTLWRQDKLAGCFFEADTGGLIICDMTYMIVYVYLYSSCLFYDTNLPVVVFCYDFLSGFIPGFYLYLLSMYCESITDVPL